MFYEAVGLMTGAEPIAQKREEFLVRPSNLRFQHMLWVLLDGRM